MRANTLLFFIAASVVIMNSSCKKDGGNNSSTFVGNGQIATQVRTPGNFTAVNLVGSGKVNITQGPTLQLTVSDDSNLLSLVQTTVKDSVLTAGYEPNINVTNDHLVFTIVMPTLVGASITGSGTFNVGGGFTTSGTLTTSISGSGGITLNGGSADSLSANISGSGTINATAFPVKGASAGISGSGEIDVTASDFLNAVIAGSGTIYYSGTPAVTQRISGDGKVIQR